MEQSFLDLGLGDGVVTVKVQSIEVKPVKVKDGKTAEKVVLNCASSSDDTRLQSVDEAWVRQRPGEYANRGIWLTLENNNVTPMSALGKIMSLYGVKQIKDLVGLELRGIHKHNGFLALLTDSSDTRDSKYDSGK